MLNLKKGSIIYHLYFCVSTLIGHLNYYYIKVQDTLALVRLL